VKVKWIAAAVLALSLAGCKSGPSTPATGNVSGSSNLNGAGATFPNPIYSKWFNEYSQQHPDVKINYQSLGSGAGIRQVTEGTVDFGASDGPMSDEALAASKIKIIHIPTVLGAVVPIYNLPGISEPIKFSPDALAGIFLGKITMWNDPTIAKDNPGVKLPAKQILVVYRSESSGTTFIMTDYLSKISPEWQSKVGKGTAVKWPAGIGQKGSEGVSSMVRQTQFAFGYVELIYAQQNKIPFGMVRNKAGKWLSASTDGVTAAAAADADNIPADYRVSITDAPGDNSYPISSFTWLLIPNPAKDTAKGKEIVGFLNWMIDHGEAEAPGLAYAPLPAAVAQRVKTTIATLQ
jgi:phosphate transport system substrate-binding protein